MFQAGTGVADYLALAAAVRDIATGNHADSATIGAGGSGYLVGDVLTVVGGTSTWVATARVTTIGGGGAVTAVVIQNGGAYTVNPTNPAATTGGTGTSCTLNLSMSATGWTAVRNTTPGGEKEIILQGVGSGSDTIFVGLKTYQQINGANTAYNWTLIGMTGFNSGLNFESQPGVSPGGVPTSAGGAYVPLKTSDAFPIDFWISVTGRRIWGVAKVQTAVITHYVSFYLGFLNAFGTSTEFPYPIYVSGSSARHDCLFNTTAPSITGLTEMVGISGKTGPGYLRLPSGTWVTVRNSLAVDTGSPTRSAQSAYLVYPCGGRPDVSTILTEDFIVAVGSSVFDWNSLIPQSGIPGTASERLQPTNNTTGALRWLVPATVVLSATPDYDVWGELDGIFWVSQAGGEANGDTILIGTDRYLMFQNGNRSAQFSFMAVKVT